MQFVQGTEITYGTKYRKGLNLCYFQFGVYDYEPSNDWMTPERRIVDNLHDFASSWQMDKSRRCPIVFQAPDTR